MMISYQPYIKYIFKFAKDIQWINVNIAVLTININYKLGNISILAVTLFERLKGELRMFFGFCTWQESQSSESDKATLRSSSMSSLFLCLVLSRNRHYWMVRKFLLLEWQGKDACLSWYYTRTGKFLSQHAVSLQLHQLTLFMLIPQGSLIHSSFLLFSGN